MHFDFENALDIIPAVGVRVAQSEIIFFSSLLSVKSESKREDAIVGVFGRAVVVHLRCLEPLPETKAQALVPNFLLVVFSNALAILACW